MAVADRLSPVAQAAWDAGVAAARAGVLESDQPMVCERCRLPTEPRSVPGSDAAVARLFSAPDGEWWCLVCMWVWA